MRSIRAIVPACILALCVGCVNQATVPPAPAGTDPASRQSHYAKYELAYEKSFWSASFHRADGEYAFGALSDLAQSYPETADVYSRATTRDEVIGCISGAGGGLAGYTLGYNLAAREDQRWSSQTQTAMYLTAGGLVLFAIVLEAAWQNPADDFAEVYNANLRRSLGLPTPPARAALRLRTGPAGIGVAF